MVFAAFLLVAMIAVGAWSLADGAGFATVALRVVVTAVVLQVGYFVMLMVFAYLPNASARSDTSRAQKKRCPSSQSVQGANDSPH
ncbi:hypothetical protein SAMN05443999_102449 [Roseovarius azorensis]|uniref:Exopolysaccharide production repressor protein n=1 Tax=Roseovarius azorensis TaxID=1287727 RepID=A0A1H7KLD7_9RHOB|nr:hypothetical protein [Roseovarius azorensis]SEK87619.1 hypothetical protein SAMN05443999_102449 [Roseovarius azorensis]